MHREQHSPGPGVAQTFPSAGSRYIPVPCFQRGLPPRERATGKSPALADKNVRATSLGVGAKPNS